MSELTQTHRSQVERIGWNNLKVSYVLQALLRSPTIVVVVLLPGLYVSVSDTLMINFFVLIEASLS
jgi:hypothetical protein